jgi:predicted  nucleic acid-binding Zn-ribbon protein
MKAEEMQQRSVLDVAAVDADLSRLDHRAKHLDEQQRLDVVQSEHRAANDTLAARREASRNLRRARGRS